MKKIAKAILQAFMFVLSFKSDSAVDEGICDYSGQGRDKYGR